MKYSIRRTDDVKTAKAMHTLIFRYDEWAKADACWIVYDESDSPAGFCTAKFLPKEDAVFLARAGVLPCAEGAHLQRRMIRARERWAREQGAQVCLTYTLYNNHRSIANLLKAGYRFYTPAYKWAGESHYFQKELA